MATEQREVDTRQMLDAYKLMLEEWHRVTGETQSSIGRVQSICLVLLGAEAYLAATSPLTNWLPVLVVFGISAFGFALLLRAIDQETRSDVRERACYTVGYALELKLTKENVFDEGYIGTFIRLHQKRLAKQNVGRIKVPEGLRKILSGMHSRTLFVAAFTIIPLAFALGTYLALNPATHFLIQPLLSVK